MANPSPDYTGEAEDQSGPHADLHSRALTRFDEITSATQEERALALSDRRFSSIAGAQWEGPWEDQWQNSIRVEVNKTAAGVEKIIADYRANRVTVNFRGVGKGSDDDTAETLNGMFRADAYWSKGQQAFDNAFDEGVNGGIGAWRLVNVYEDPNDPENDYQRIAFKTIVDADQSVFFDMNSQTYDKSDARFAFIVTAMSREAFCEEYGDDKATDWPDEILKPYYDWYTPDVVRVCEYYEVEDNSRLLRIFRNIATGDERREWAEDLDADDLAAMEIEGWKQTRTRKAKRRRVMKSVLSGSEVLRAPKPIAGEMIPIVPFYGKRWFIDNMERTRGHVRLAKDPQRIYNAQISKLTELAAIAPTERPILTPDQIAGHADSWAEANINRAPYALINPQLDPQTGQVVSLGPIGMVTPPAAPPALVGLIQITANDIAELTSADDGANQVKSNVSAEAMDIAATRIDAKSGIYMDNMRQSMQRCGEIYQSMARDVYFEEDREVETLTEDGEFGTATLMEGATDERGNYKIRNDLARGEYKVVSDVTEATTTRRDKTVKTLLNGAQIVAAFNPELASAMVGTAFINMDGEGIGDLQGYIRSQMVQQGIVPPNDEEKAAMEEAAQNQQPDPQAAFLDAAAQEKQALAGKALADTALSKASAIQKLADADLKQSQAKDNSMERKVGVMGKLQAMFRPQAPGSTLGQ